MRLQAIREALDTALSSLARSPTVFAYDPGDRSGHNITILPGVEYITLETIGSNYELCIYLDLRIEVPGRLADSQIAMDDYLSTDTTSLSSVVNAVLANPRLGGLVEDVIYLGCDGPNLDVDPLTALVHFKYLASRG